MPERHRKAFILGYLGAGIGAGIGALLNPNPIYAGIGAVVGFILSVMFSFIVRKGVTLEALVIIEQKIFFVLALICFLFAVVSIFAFAQTQQVIFLFSIVIFGLVGVYLMIRQKRQGL